VTDRAHRAAAVTDFLQRALVGVAVDVTQLEAMARAAGLLGKRQQIQHTKAFKKAKRSLGIRSVRAGVAAPNLRHREQADGAASISIGVPAGFEPLAGSPMRIVE
jgi:hypothetical protein